MREWHQEDEMILEKINGRALVTGASAGIGAEFARQLAAAGLDLILTARRRDRLETMAKELSTRYGVEVAVVKADLTNRQELEQLEQRIRSTSDLVVLVNNAGFGVSGSYSEQDIGNHQRMIDVHVTATVRLTHAALPGMVGRRQGYIINVSSVAGFVPVQGGPGYSASKAYLNSFSTNLNSETESKGVRIQALCPGYTRTEFHTSPTYQGKEPQALPTWVWMTVEEVVRYSLEKLGSSKVIVIPGLKNRIICYFLRTAIGTGLMSFRSRLFNRAKATT